uniref:Uncharacterized protein n=1 Tax=Ananas comosus var. bracteatus TaxID=296719 RepID=A0A6V7NPD9_ANACO|nr:unnamed protein product [Ananas comosus var. bracteatus]
MQYRYSGDAVPILCLAELKPESTSLGHAVLFRYPILPSPLFSKQWVARYTLSRLQSTQIFEKSLHRVDPRLDITGSTFSPSKMGVELLEHDKSRQRPLSFHVFGRTSGVAIPTPPEEQLPAVDVPSPDHRYALTLCRFWYTSRGCGRATAFSHRHGRCRNLPFQELLEPLESGLWRYTTLVNAKEKKKEKKKKKKKKELKGEQAWRPWSIFLSLISHLWRLRACGWSLVVDQSSTLEDFELGLEHPREPLLRLDLKNSNSHLELEKGFLHLRRLVDTFMEQMKERKSCGGFGCMRTGQNGPYACYTCRNVFLNANPC